MSTPAVWITRSGEETEALAARLLGTAAGAAMRPAA